MFKLEKIKNKNIYKFSIEGKIDEKSITEFSKILAEKAAENEAIKVIGVISEFPHLANFATFKEAAKMKFEALKVVGKYAILTDKNWLEMVLPVANFMTPKIPLKAFGLDEEKEAIQWLEADFTETVKAENYLTKMDVGHIPATNIYTVSLDNDVDEAGMIALQEIFDQRSKEHKINLLVTINKFPDFESFKSFYEGLKVDLRSFGNVNKYAIVSNKNWIHNWVKVADFIVPGMTISHFTDSEKPQAIDWLKE